MPFRFAFAVALLIISLLSTPLAAQDTVVEPTDPVLRDVARMLEADVSEDIVRQWLSSSTRRPAFPDADDIVALKRAGASDELLTHLLDLAATPPPPAPPAPPAPSPEAPPAAEPPPAATLTDPLDDVEVPVRFELTYVPFVLEDEEEWDLMVYLDGKPLSIVPSSTIFRPQELEFRYFVAPGRHTLRVMRERHVEGRREWQHWAYAAGSAFSFEVADNGAPAEVELIFKQNVLSISDPLSFRFSQGRNVVVIEDQGGNPEDWIELCEEKETRPQTNRSRAQRCVTWESWWAPVQVPPRHEVRRALALFDYRPVPRDQDLD
ncbi:MAG: hypothetical protein AAGN46_09005 [Acidobacteriota bacterium]